MPKKSTSKRTSEDLLRLEYVPLDEVLAQRLRDNPKRHDVHELSAIIQRHGYVDPGKFDSNLNGGAGGFVYGNGRPEALAYLRDSGHEPPRGVGHGPDGAWLVPVIFGVDAASEAAAQALAVDHNNVTLAGQSDEVRLGIWEPGAYARMVERLSAEDEAPVSVDLEAVSHLLGAADEDQEEGDAAAAAVRPAVRPLPDVTGEEDGPAALPPDAPGENGFDYNEGYAVIVTCDGPAHQEQVYEALVAQGYSCKVVAV